MAAELWARIRELEASSQPHWRALARQRASVDCLIREAAYFERIASAIELRNAIDDLAPF